MDDAISRTTTQYYEDKTNSTQNQSHTQRSTFSWVFAKIGANGESYSKIAMSPVTVGESLIGPAPAVKDLRAVFDMPMTMVPMSMRFVSLQATISETLAKSGDSLTVTHMRGLSMPLLCRASTWTMPRTLCHVSSPRSYWPVLMDLHSNQAVSTGCRLTLV